MAVKTINLTFDGYWREINKDGIPKKSGVYLTYSCKYNPPTKEGERGTVDLTKLIYIGEAEDANDRIATHDKWDDWRKQVPKGEEICFSFAEVASPDRERAECALIYYHKPVCCDKSTETFDYDETTIISSGCCKFIKSPITVKRTNT
ncbi:MAG: GIY-YIG nuclease family protein [Candidatus Bathyarchaeia archaeon]